MKSTAVNVNRSVGRAKSTEPFFINRGPEKGVPNAGVDLGESWCFNVQDAPAAMGLFPPMTEVPDHFSLIPCLTAFKHSMISRVGEVAVRTFRVKDKSPAGKGGPRGVLVKHESQQGFLSLGG
jgi:hypothetical protein